MVKQILLLLILFVRAELSLASLKEVGIVLIDMQPDFYKTYNVAKSKEVKSLIQKHLELIAWAKSKQLPILIFEYDGKGPTDPRLLSMLKGSHHKIIIKTTDDGFSEYNKSFPETVKFFRDQKIKKLIIGGINGGACVHDSVEGAGVQGFRLFTTPEIVGDLMSNPPIYPDGTWTHKYMKLKSFTSLTELLKKAETF